MFSLAPVLIILFSTLISSFLVFPFGQIQSNRLVLPGAHAVDSTWHIALINTFASGSFINPLYPPNPIQNYHFLTDFFLSVVVRLTGLSAEVVFFRLAGPLFYFFFASSLYFLVKRLSNSTLAAVAAVILCTLTSNLYYLAPRVYPAAVVNPSVAWVDFFSTKSVNYPLTFSLVVLNITLYLLFWRKRSLTSLLFISFLGSLLSGIKLYTSMVYLPALALVAAYFSFKRDFYYLKVFLLTSFFSALVFFSTFGSSPGRLLVEPFWYIKTMYESSDRLNTPDWELRRQYLLAHHSYPGIIKLYAIGLTVFGLINFGPLTFGWLSLLFHRHALTVLLGVIGLTGLALGLLVVYSQTAIVTVQFFYYPLYISGLFTALSLGYIAKKHRLLAVCTLMILWFLLLPGVKHNLDYYQSSSRSSLPTDMVSALSFLRNLPSGTILVHPQFQIGSVVTAYTHKPVYVGDEIVLYSLGIDPKARKTLTNRALSCLEPLPSDIKYILTITPSCLSSQPAVKHLWQSGETTIFEQL